MKIALPLSITLLSIALFFVGIAITSPELLVKTKGISTKSEPLIFDSEFEDTEADSNHEASAKAVSASPQAKPIKTSAPVNYQVESTPTNINSDSSEWTGYADKEVFCKDIADRVMQQPLPEIDQSNLPPELRVTPDLEAMWVDAYQSCMNEIRNY